MANSPSFLVHPGDSTPTSFFSALGEENRLCGLHAWWVVRVHRPDGSLAADSPARPQKREKSHWWWSAIGRHGGCFPGVVNIFHAIGLGPEGIPLPLDEFMAVRFRCWSNFTSPGSASLVLASQPLKKRHRPCSMLRQRLAQGVSAGPQRDRKRNRRQWCSLATPAGYDFLLRLHPSKGSGWRRRLPGLRRARRCGNCRLGPGRQRRS